MNEPAEVWKYVRGFENMSLCDWPGRTSCIIFLGGCNLRCPTCHNFQLAWDMQTLPVLDAQRIKSYIRDRAGWLDGITITGGEPTTVPGIGELLWEIKKIGLPIKVDTNGMRPEVVNDLFQCELADTFAVDVKGPWAKYPALTGHAISAIAAEANLTRIFDLARTKPEAFYFRTTRMPGLTESDLRTVRGYLPSEFELKIQKYVPPRRMPENAKSNHEERRPAGNVVN
ncbi:MULTISPECIES: anaerobic ribonucleoside-triphosphate reductase activating protein [unclassified Pseudodesulfovibrio]|uniref:anaerobic ribonucleoside-triphosphate reductase activating protein n=1 Tax=unclassified Pseudodesulfovibrio TaxID=2661612 RepID=UPI000FEBA09C|nr:MULTISPECIES: anaerobic ribonucleoside-triphosphate reductase activating protein [unclassified Pseudodesulfovibrio]MCJ2165819.1 anaerobic ribonucleoside-triphosphate reductase activating protein [Pseudodesulfovibrio sp. S3-i]RWU02751.1 anaerobic ribonucleoside-triphosphate reductase activating protein [Pseudodesulfovibrio sp. S3]